MNKRRAKIEAFLESHGAKHDILNVEHITSYNPTTRARTITPVSVVELSCRNVRESTLTKIGTTKLDDGNGGSCDIQRAKTSLQRKRNEGLTKTCDKLKLAPSCAGKPVKIAWKMEGTKDRAVTIDDVPAFLQTSDDSIGNFVAPFLDLSS